MSVHYWPLDLQEHLDWHKLQEQSAKLYVKAELYTKHQRVVICRAATNVLNQFRTNVVWKWTNIERSIYLTL